MKSEGGTVHNGFVKWNSLGEKIYEFELETDSAENKIRFNGTVIQKVVENKRIRMLSKTKNYNDILINIT